MSHRALDPGRDHFDLLPFIAILLCTLGSLLFVTLSMASLSLGPASSLTWVAKKGQAGAGLPSESEGLSGLGSRAGKTPILLEWDGSTVTIHQDRRKIRIPWEATISNVLTGEGTSEEMRSFLNAMGQQSTLYFVYIAVRPSGFKSFYLLRELIRRQGIDVGYEPIGQHQPVQLRVQEEAFR